MGVYASIGEPKNGASQAQDVPFSAYHGFASDGADNPYGDDYQQAAEERYRVVGAATWTAGPSTTGSQNYVSYAAGLPTGDYERQVRVKNTATSTWSAWSTSAFFTITPPVTGATITAPAAGATIPSPTVTMTWTTPFPQVGYQIEVRTAASGGGTLEWASGVVTSNVGSAVVNLPSPSGTRYLRLRYLRLGGLWSSWVERNVVVNYVPPAAPTVVATPTDPGSLGSLHALSVTATHPTPAGGQPTVTSMDVWVRPLGDTGAGWRVIAGATPTGAKVWDFPAARRYQVRVLAKASFNNTETWSAWTTATADNTIKGVVLLDPADVSGTRRGYRYNDDEATDTWTVDSALVEYAGRALPAVEYGDAEQRVLEVPLLHSKGLASSDAAALVALLRRRAVVLYRDRRGRKAYGLLEVASVEDRFYGHATGIKVTATHYAADPEAV